MFVVACHPHGRSTAREANIQWPDIGQNVWIMLIKNRLFKLGAVYKSIAESFKVVYRPMKNISPRWDLANGEEDYLIANIYQVKMPSLASEHLCWLRQQQHMFIVTIFTWGKSRLLQLPQCLSPKTHSRVSDPIPSTIRLQVMHGLMVQFTCYGKDTTQRPYSCLQDTQI